MKKIIITESKLKRLFNFLMNEAVGVPENILETSEEIYEDILIELDFLKGVKENYKFQIDGDYRISDVEFKKVEIFLEVKIDEDLSEPSLISMGFGLDSERAPNTTRFLHKFDDSITIRILVGFPNKWKLDDLKKFFKENKTEMLSSLAHELKHSYDYRKVKTTSTGKQAKYKSYSELNIGVPTIDKFIFALYFTHSIENLVRPVELASILKSNNISKKEFYDFFIETKLFQTLKLLRTETYEDFRNDLKKWVPQIKDHFEEEGTVENVQKMSDDEVIDIVLNKTLETLLNVSGSELFGMLLDSPLEVITGFVGEKDKFFKKFIQDISKYKNGPTFFKAQFEYFRIIADKMIRKLSKLFSIVPTEKKDTNESKSIKNWSSHHKLKGTKALFPINKKTTK